MKTESSTKNCSEHRLDGKGRTAPPRRSNRFDSCRTLSLSVLHMLEVATVASFMKLLAESLSGSTGKWHQTPNMVVAGVRFQTRKRVIAVVEILCVVDGILAEGSYYKKVVPSEVDKGYFNCLHTVTNKRLPKNAYCRAAKKLLITELQKIVTSKMEYLPSDVFRIGLSENFTSILVLFRFRGCKTPSLAIALTPAIAGRGVPEGTNECLKRLFEKERVADGLGASWFLTPPYLQKKCCPYSWSLTFPRISDLISDFTRIIPAIHFLVYVAEVRQWCKVGLQEPHNAILSLAMQMDKDRIFRMARSPLEEQVAVLFQQLHIAVSMRDLPDYAVPARNYIDCMSSKQMLKFENELQIGLENLQVIEDFALTSVGEHYPLPLPEHKRKLRMCRSSAKQCCTVRDCISELSSDGDYFPFPYKLKGGDPASDSSSQVSILKRIPSVTPREFVRTSSFSMDQTLYQKQMLTLFVLLAVAVLALVLILPTVMIKNETDDEDCLL